MQRGLRTMPASRTLLLASKAEQGMRVVALLEWSSDSFVRWGTLGFRAVLIKLQHLNITCIKDVTGSNGAEEVDNPDVSDRDIARVPRRAPVRPLGKQVSCPPRPQLMPLLLEHLEPQRCVLQQLYRVPDYCA